MDIQPTKTLIYLKKGEITLWQKHWLWHKWIPKKDIPKQFIRVERKLGIKTNYTLGCFWGTQEKAPEETGYMLLGELNYEIT